MYKILTLFTCFCFFTHSSSNAQIKERDQRTSSFQAPKKEREEKKPPAKRPYGYLGTGVGFDFGGIGIRAELPVVNFLSLFGGAGYNLADIGANGGLLFKLLPEKNVRPIVSCMYGYNAVIIVSEPQYYYQSPLEKKNIYYGITAGAGFEVDFGVKKANKFGVMLLVPFRSDAYFRDAQRAGTNLPPVALSLGVHFGI